MRLTVALLAGVILSQPLFAAPKKKPAAVQKVKSAFEAKFLTFSQLSALPQAKRDQYVQDVVKLIISMERANSHYEIADNGMSLEELKYKFATMQQWLQFLPEAAAERAYQRTNPGQGSGVMVWDGAAWTCGGGYALDFSVPGCLKVNDDGTTMFSSLDLKKQKCGEGMQAIPHPDPYASSEIVYKGCMSNAGWTNLAPERRAAILRSNEKFDPWFDPNAFLRQSHEQQVEIAFGGKGDANSPQVNSSLAGTPGANAPGAAPAPAPTAPQASPAPSTPAPSAPDVAKPAPATPPVAVSQPPPAAEKPEVAPQPEKPDLSKEDPNADKCLPEATTCDDPNDPEAKKKYDEAVFRFRKTAKFEGLDANICIVGGFPSKYESAKKQAGTCQPVYKWGPAHCKQNQVLCNPVLFCHTLENSKGKPVPRFLCVDKRDTAGQSNPQWTAACAAELKKRLAPGYLEEITYKVKNPKTKKVTWMKKKADKPLKACSPSDVKGLGGFQEEWDKMAAGLEKLVDVWCGKNDDFKALFCRECQVVKAQMYAMNKKATGNGCGTTAAAPTDGQQESSTTTK